MGVAPHSGQQRTGGDVDVTQQEQHAASLASPEILSQIEPIARRPLFSDEEQAFYETLPPEQQAIMTLEARRQHESLMTSILNNLLKLKGL